MEKDTRNILRNAVTKARRLLEDAVGDLLTGRYGIYPDGTTLPDADLPHLDDEGRAERERLLVHYERVRAGGFADADAVDQLKREIAFTHLNRLAAFKLMEARDLIREAVSRGVDSRGVHYYIAEHPDDERRYDTGDKHTAYRNFLKWQAAQFSGEISVLFNPEDPANIVFPPQRTLDDVLELLNSEALAGIWTEDETIGWVYQYFTPKELRDRARSESQAPRNSYELAFRNQFFTPRYVVEFLTDNTLGRTWYEMQGGDTHLTGICRYLVRRPNEIFLTEGEQAPEGDTGGDGLTQEDLLRQPVYIPYRRKKDPRRLKILDPACGSGHFLLYTYDLLTHIYEEAYADPDATFNALRREYKTLDDLRRDVPRLILRHNLHGVDIDPRAIQIAALALWLRAQRTYQEHGYRRGEARPQITRSNLVTAEPMPGDRALLDEFCATLNPPLLGELVRNVFDKMELAGEAGSLLKIEEEIREDIARAKQEWDTPQQRTLPGMEDDRPRQRSMFDVSAITDAEFFDRAERLVLEALQAYAEQAGNGRGLGRRLFAEDTARGFAFIELMRQRYDVVLMNPPFGEVATKTRSYLYNAIPIAAQDIYMAFVERWVELLSNNGKVGVLSNRLGFYNNWSEKWRTKFYGSPYTLRVFADLGYGVLDDAVVEAAAYIIDGANIISTSYFIDLLGSRSKGDDVFIVTNSLAQGAILTNVRMLPVTVFNDIPNSQLIHWCSPSWLQVLSQSANVSNNLLQSRLGLTTGDNFRFVRLMWEVDPSSIKPFDEWTPFVKGGEYEPYYAHTHLLFNWTNHNLARRASNPEYYGIRGATYTERTTSNLSVRNLSAGTLISYKGPGVFLVNDQYDPACIVGLLNSAPYQFIVELLVGGGDSSQSGTAARDFMPSTIELLPEPMNAEELLFEITPLARRLIELSIRHRCIDEIREYFVTPFESTEQFQRISMWKIAELDLQVFEQRLLEASENVSVIDEKAVNHLQLNDSARIDIMALLGRPFPKGEVTPEKVNRIKQYLRTGSVPAEIQKNAASRAVAKLCFVFDDLYETICHLEQVSPASLIKFRRSQLAPGHAQVLDLSDRTISYTVGVALGRWDIRYATGEKPIPDLPDPFDPLPTCPPGMLQGADGLPLTASPPGYPLDVVWDGILVDDEGHPDDIIRRVRSVLALLWDDPHAIEAEMLDILGEKSLRGYFRKSGGFWMSHVKRYSKSRRKAPIYWYLQSANGNYGLWLYYHRLNKDLYYQALEKYVRPKLALEQAKAQRMRNEGESARAIAAQDDLVSEIHDFQDRLERVAALGLEPDLNDGVVLNIAPLHELVPWKEAEKYWKELTAGKYEWATIAGQLRERGLVKAKKK